MNLAGNARARRESREGTYYSGSFRSSSPRSDVLLCRSYFTKLLAIIFILTITAKNLSQREKTVAVKNISMIIKELGS